MITAKEAFKQSLKGDPERALIIAETKIKEAVKEKLQSTTISISKHLYGWAEIRLVMDHLTSNGFFCIPDLCNPKSNNHTFEVRW